MKINRTIEGILCACLLLFSNSIAAQNDGPLPSQSIIWEDDFSDPAKWVVYNESDPDADWVITSEDSLIPIPAFIPLELPSDSNGFALMNGDQYGSGSLQDAYLEYAESIDLTFVDSVSFEFYQAARDIDTEVFFSEFYVEFSIDGGNNWVSIEINNPISQDDSPNPELITLDFPELLDGQSDVRLRFRYLAEWGFFWAVDDLSIKGFDILNFVEEANVLDLDTVFFCNEDQAVLSAQSGFTDYLWSTGETTNSITVSSDGVYHVSASYTPENFEFDTLISEVTVVDSVFVSLLSVELTFGDTTISNGESVTLEALVNTFESSGVASGCNDLFISEYSVGIGNNRALEFYNPTAQSIDLDNYVIQRWSNGEQGATDQLELQGVVAPFGTWVVVNGQTEDIDLGVFISPACDPALQALADQLGNLFPDPLYMNGNDALVLVKGEGSTLEVVDIFGKPGEDPGQAWTDENGNFISSGQTLIRKPEVLQGVIQPPTQFIPLQEWTPIGLDVWTNLGTHESNCSLEPSTLSIEWSTGESGSVITVSPDTTTTYTVEVNNGIFSCSESVTITIDTCLINSGVLSLTFGDDAFCLGNGNANVVQAEVVDNIGFGRFGLADANTFDILKGSQTGVFNLNAFPPGDYLIGHVSFKEEGFFNGVNNVGDFDGCFQVSNAIVFSTAINSAGTIATSSPTAFCVGDGEPSFLSLQLFNNPSGFNFRWVVVTAELDEIVIISDSSNFSLEGLSAGSYRLYHVAYGNGIDLSEIDPQNIGACVAVSNRIDLLAIECSPASISVFPNPAISNTSVTFSTEEGGMALLELYDLTGKMMRSLYRGDVLAGEEKLIQSDLSDLPRGVYIFRLTTNLGVTQEKIVLTK